MATANITANEPPAVVLSYGLGVDSTAILLRWLSEPASRDFDLADLLVVTAHTGTEWPDTIALAERHCGPALRMPMSRALSVPMDGEKNAPPGLPGGAFWSARCRRPWERCRC